MFVIGCIVLSLVACVTQGQQHGHQSQSICHSNHQQLTEDQVVQRVVSDMDENGDGVVELGEMYIFFTDLVERGNDVFYFWMHNLTENALVTVVNTYLSNVTTNITKHDFTHFWHTRFHDSIAFTEAFFDIFIDHNDNGLVDGDEVLKLRNDALRDFDANGDHHVQTAEMENFFESIYKNPDCVQAVG